MRAKSGNSTNRTPYATKYALIARFARMQPLPSRNNQSEVAYLFLQKVRGTFSAVFSSETVS